MGCWFSYPSEVKEWKEWRLHPAIRRYVIGRQLGKGAFSEVYMARRKPGVFHPDVALKVIFLGNPKLSEQAVHNLNEESDILRNLHHPNIVNVKQTHMWPARRILVLEEEVLYGEELLDGVQEAIASFHFKMTESWARQVMQQIFSAMSYMHSKGVLHRDIKPENLRFSSRTHTWMQDNKKLNIKIIDFGLSCMLRDPPDVGWMGTPGYISPEVIEMKPHSPAMDMYACGAVLYVLLAGSRHISTQDAIDLVYSKWQAREYPRMLQEPRWAAVSSAGQDLVYQLLERDPAKRITAAQALKHPWMQGKRKLRSWGPLASLASLPGAASRPGSLSHSSSGRGPPLRPSHSGDGAAHRPSLTAGQFGSIADAEQLLQATAADVAQIKESNELLSADRLARTAVVTKWQDLLAQAKLMRAHAQARDASADGSAEQPTEGSGNKEWKRVVGHAYAHAVSKPFRPGGTTVQPRQPWWLGSDSVFVEGLEPDSTATGTDAAEAAEADDVVGPPLQLKRGAGCQEPGKRKQMPRQESAPAKLEVQVELEALEAAQSDTSLPCQHLLEKLTVAAKAG